MGRFVGTYQKRYAERSYAGRAVNVPPRRRRGCIFIIYSDIFVISLYRPFAQGRAAPLRSFTHSYTFPNMSNSPRSFGSRLPPDTARSRLLAWYQAYCPSRRVVTP